MGDALSSGSWELHSPQELLAHWLLQKPAALAQSTPEVTWKQTCLNWMINSLSSLLLFSAESSTSCLFYTDLLVYKGGKTRKWGLGGEGLGNYPALWSLCSSLIGVFFSPRGDTALEIPRHGGLNAICLVNALRKMVNSVERNEFCQQGLLWIFSCTYY